MSEKRFENERENRLNDEALDQVTGGIQVKVRLIRNIDDPDKNEPVSQDDAFKASPTIPGTIQVGPS